MWSTSRQWYERIEPRGSGSTWISGSTLFQNTIDEDLLNASFCAEDGTYDYAYSADSYVYNDMICVPSFASEAVLKLDSNILFVPTIYEEEWSETVNVSSNGGTCASACGSYNGASALCGSGNNTVQWRLGRSIGGGQCLCTCMYSRDVFVPGVTGLEFAFDHTIEVQMPATAVSSAINYILKSGDRTDDVLLIVRENDGREFMRYNPGTGSVKLSLHQILSLASVSLEDELPNNPNFFTGKRSNPALRVTGLEIECRIESYNKDDFRHNISEHNGPLVYVEFHATKKWTSKPETTYLHVDPSGQQSSRYRYTGPKIRDTNINGIPYPYSGSFSAVSKPKFASKYSFE